MAKQKVNILIPMAGEGSRFLQAGWVRPKPLIEVGGKAMIKWVVDNMDLGAEVEATFIFIIQRKHDNIYHIKEGLEALVPGCKVAYAEALTEGAACTTLLAQEHIDDATPLVIINADQYMEWDAAQFIKEALAEGVDGSIVCFHRPMELNDVKWSYAKLDEAGHVTDVQEKVVISPHATVGLYFWAEGADYVKYTNKMIEKDIRVKGEFYVAPVYNESVLDGQKHVIFNIEKFWGLGVPFDLAAFESNFLHKPATSIREATCAYVAAFNSRDIEAVTACLAPKFALEDPAGRFEGRETVAEYIKGIFDANEELSFRANTITVDEGSRTSVIEFELVMGGETLVGTDIITWSMDPQMLEMRAYLYKK